MESPLWATEINLRGSVARKGLKRFWNPLSRGSVRCAHCTPSLWSAASARLYPSGSKESLKQMVADTQPESGRDGLIHPD